MYTVYLNYLLMIKTLCTYSESDMAYASLSCLYHAIHLLLNSNRISLASFTAEILESAELEVQSLQKTLQTYDQIQNPTQGVFAADARIRDEARKLQDQIESEASAQFHSLSQIYGRLYLNLNHLTHDVDRFLQTAKQMSAEYIEELNKKPPPPAVAVAVAVADSSTTGRNYSDDDIVGLSDPFHTAIRDLILGDDARLTRFAITGMAGIGKTTFARKLFHDPLVEQKIECRAFVRVGHNYEYEEILRAIIAQLNVDSSDKFSYEKLEDFLVRSLRRRKFLIVLDDVWDDNFHHDFINLFQENLEGSFIFITSRIRKHYGWNRCVSYDFSLFFLKEDESWELLRRKVFGEDCPPLLVKPGKKIASNCEGLPLLVMAVAEILVKAPMTPEYWSEVADMQYSVFEDAIDQIYEVLLPSYLYLEQRSKACFLYMCAFPKDYVARRSRIINLWRAERFSDGDGSIFDNIVFNNLVVTRQKRSNLTEEAKACNLHIVYRHLSKREAENNNFICVLSRYVADGLDDHIKDKRHLAIYHNTLLAITEVYDSIASFVSSLRSVLCTGPYHQYQVPICLELKMLRVLDALTIRFYEFPVEVVKLIQLRYLSLTTNANLPPSISKLWFLEFLIVHQHSRINHSVVESYVPVKIWELQELEHLQIVGRNLPHPPSGTILPNLRQLLDVGVQTCAKGVLESMPKLQKLRIQIESAPDDAQNLSCFNNLFYLGELKSLRCSVMNPKFLLNPTVPPRVRSDYFNRYYSLQKLSLSGFGYPWADMSMIAQIRYLKVLKLQCYAFRGEKWDTKGTRFLYLKNLLIEDTDLAEWIFVRGTFPVLDGLTLKNCYKLQQISELRLHHKIQLVDCHPSVETWAKRTGESDVKVKYTWK